MPLSELPILINAEVKYWDSWREPNILFASIGNGHHANMKLQASQALAGACPALYTLSIAFCLRCSHLQLFKLLTICHYETSSMNCVYISDSFNLNGYSWGHVNLKTEPSLSRSLRRLLLFLPPWVFLFGMRVSVVWDFSKSAPTLLFL